MACLRVDYRREAVAVTKVPQDVVDHCARFKLCEGCPLGTCVAPLVNADDPKWAEWIEERTKVVREIMK